MGTFFGPFVGAALFSLLEDVVVHLDEHWQLFVGAIFIACVLFLPLGIWGSLLHGGRTMSAASRASPAPDDR